MYHEEGLGQPEIAERLNLSQSRVSRLLKEAQDRGVVRTLVLTPPGFYSELEEEVRSRFGLRDVVIADAAAQDDAPVLSAIGAAAAGYIEETLGRGERLGISSRSAALLSMVESLAPIRGGTVEVVVQTLGAVGNPAMRAQASRLTDRLAQMTGGDPVYLNTPGVVTSRAVHDGLLSDDYVREAVDAWKSLSTLLTGIGSARAPRTAWGTALPREDLARLVKRRAVGDVCLNFFDTRGAVIQDDLRERIIGIPAEDLLAVPRRIGIAGGRSKTTAVAAACRGSWINVLVTDQYTARRLIGQEQ
jgi:DNA-binding transcriptional regulator LsrR (DeoR family)